MKKLLCAVMLWCVSAQATTTLTGTLRDLGTNTASSRSFVRLWLRGCGANPARVNGTGLLLPKYIDFTPDASGVISGTVYSTRNAAGTGDGDIECGGSKQSVWYGLQAFRDGKPDVEIPVHANSGSTLNMSNITPISTSPVASAPSGDSTYQRLDGGNNASGSYVPSGNNTVDLGATTAAWRTGYFATSVLPKTDNSADLGSASMGWRSGYFSTSVLPKTDNSSDIGVTGTRFRTAYLRGLDVQGTSSATPATIQIIASSGLSNSVGGNVLFQSGAGNGASPGGYLQLIGGTGGSTGAGGDILFTPGPAGGGAAKAGGNRFSGQGAPALSSATEGEFYFDSAVNRFLASENGGAYRYFAGTLLNQQGALSAVVGTGADATVYTYTVPANTMLAGKGIRVKVIYRHTTGSASVTYKMKLGSTTIQSYASVSTTDSDYVIYEIFNNSGVQNAQNVSAMSLVASVPGAAVFTSAENAANALALTFTMSVAASDQVTPKFFLVEQIN